jgi:hypothetical protein
MYIVYRNGRSVKITFNSNELCRFVKKVDGVVEVKHNGSSLGLFLGGVMVAPGAV